VANQVGSVILATNLFHPGYFSLIIFFRFVWRTFAVLVNTFVCWVCFEINCLFAGKANHQRAIRRWVPRWARINLAIFRIRVLVDGAFGSDGQLVPGHDANGRGRIFVANHRSGLDIPLLLSLVEARCISRHDLANWPIIGRGARRVGTLFVDRESRRSGAAVLKEVAHAVDNGLGVAMFPEGTSYKGDEVREFRTGAFNAARRANAQLMPVGLAYSDEAAYFFHETFMAHIKRLVSAKSMSVAVQFGAPIDVDGRETPVVVKDAHDRVQELVKQARSRLENN
jgi:1-acyl-sn-glycerol-3-phosphate acyltransferase